MQYKKDISAKMKHMRDCRSRNELKRENIRIQNNLSHLEKTVDFEAHGKPNSAKKCSTKNDVLFPSDHAVPAPNNMMKSMLNKDSDILTEISNNSAVQPNRRRYSEKFYDFSTILCFQSFSTYELLRRVLPFPSRRMIYKRTFPRIQTVEKQLFDLKYLDDLLISYRSLNCSSPEEVISACISVDGVSLERYIYNSLSKKEIKDKVFKSNTFHDEASTLDVPKSGDQTLDDDIIEGSDFIVIQLQPYDVRYKCQPIHVVPVSNGHSSKKIITIIDLIVQRMMQHNIKVHNVSVDGDTTFDYKFSEMYDAITKGKTLEETIKNLDGPSLMWVSDPLHLLKCVRSRLVSRPVSLNLRIPDTVSIDSIKDVLHEKPRVYSENASDKVQDMFPIKLFTTSNLIDLLKSDLNNEASAFFPFVMLREALMTTHISIPLRAYMFEAVCFYCGFYIEYMKFASQKKWKNVPQRIKETSESKDPGSNAKSNDTSISLYTLIGMKRIFCTAFTYLKLMRDTLKNNSGLDRSGSHPLENYFGHLRSITTYSQNFTNISRSMAKTIVKKECMSNIGILPSITTRLNYGGARINAQDMTLNMEFEPILRPKELVLHILKYIDENFNFEKIALENNAVPYDTIYDNISLCLKDLQMLYQIIHDKCMGLYEPGVLSANNIQGRNIIYH